MALAIEKQHFPALTSFPYQAALVEESPDWCSAPSPRPESWPSVCLPHGHGEPAAACAPNRWAPQQLPAAAELSPADPQPSTHHCENKTSKTKKTPGNTQIPVSAILSDAALSKSGARPSMLSVHLLLLRLQQADSPPCICRVCETGQAEYTHSYLQSHEPDSQASALYSE